MTRTFIGSKDVHESRDVRTQHDPMLTGADRRIARDEKTVSWLTKVYAEMEHGARGWPFNKRRLRDFLRTCGIDTGAALKADEDALPIPDHVSDVAVCMDRLKSASFLDGPVGNVCMVLHRRAQVAPRRR